MNNSTVSLTATSPLAQWLSYLENSHFKAIDLGLDRIKSVAKALDLLTPAPFVITVGGTNGKGTTCRLLETVLLKAGYRVGVYSSPHLLRYNERVRIQDQELPDEAHTASFAFIEQHKRESLTYFEFSTLSALHLFKQAKLDVVILEVGLGGRLDATNIVDSDVAVITSIDIDHVDFLGADREQIGFEKAGIFRAHKPAIIGEPNIPQRLLEHAKSLGCQISCRDQDWHFRLQAEHWDWCGQKVRLKNLPCCQIPLANAATALATFEQLPFQISEEVIRQSLQEVELVGRFQTLKPDVLFPLAENLAKPWADFPQMIIDVGHNPHAALYLAEKLTALKAKITGKIVAVCGILKDKDAQGVLSPLLPVIDEWHCVTLEGYRGQSGQALFVTLQQIAQGQSHQLHANTASSVALGVKQALATTTAHDVILVFGSFYTVGEFLQLL
ncbi:bifunctional tetrahydrofolate synthase/dihydrofolate synthase [Pasteurella multocida subsp. multocida]|uniref:Dihydrofolate synthase/folylpolyglutamate synthase n=1 Tax=Pasteurella multocida TaxID=747 RepID=A0A9X3UUS7_PASMD|nr:bifunctional tetrahydrofolate synthase/dihydrofolate synthase [Pasteurella multocida]MBF6981295.1 bifunctional tetrahydrofolate synthase/dihydrofolate synthase [Pasteurella multocida]MBF6986041.1 bifunctional tetrahydrofolate synthase/dihydrofolate synthase [Pasteurella multocida]MDA5608735.1 bifunctional tetrahydrofolate synthase/dihydrofolate synthase [Pasteurella multocida subsp. multocida]MDA5616236.1 bifunctional tetrahydrofolate synthase/dihydrofolate synthase [Pasteurella multocida]M